MFCHNQSEKNSLGETSAGVGVTRADPKLDKFYSFSPEHDSHFDGIGVGFDFRDAPLVSTTYTFEKPFCKCIVLIE